MWFPRRTQLWCVRHAGRCQFVVRLLLAASFTTAFIALWQLGGQQPTSHWIWYIPG
jgi:hypothetical protein